MSDQTGTSDALLVALLALLIEERSASKKGEGLRKPEVLLDDCGIPRDVSARILGKSSEAVRKAVERARKGSASSGTNSAGD